LGGEVGPIFHNDKFEAVVKVSRLWSIIDVKTSSGLADMLKTAGD
jgi:hypothetical protein